jgi:hypothetical protein
MYLALCYLQALMRLLSPLPKKKKKKEKSSALEGESVRATQAEDASQTSTTCIYAGEFFWSEALRAAERLQSAPGGVLVAQDTTSHHAGGRAAVRCRAVNFRRRTAPEQCDVGRP